MTRTRTHGFKIGVYHGKTLPEDDKREYKIQRDLFLIGKVKLNFSKENTIKVKIFAYEVPIEEGASRVKCIDLLGYDKDFNIYIFELKRTQGDPLEKVVNQINDYSKKIIKKLDQIESEFKDAFLFQNISFNKACIKKIILAPREYYTQPVNKTYIKKCIRENDILLGYFGGIAKNNETKLRRSGIECININFQR
jgi:hypothetical protein